MPTATPAAWILESVDEPALQRMAAWLALVLTPGDVVTLAGDLGAGKTTFARALIRALTDAPELEVPSPTFALVQDYACPRCAIIHADLYRLGSPTDVAELGLFDDAGATVTLIEWADRAAALVPPDYIAVAISDAADGEARRVAIIGHGANGERIERLARLAAFAARAGWTGAPRYLDGDASVRAYARLQERDRPLSLAPVEAVGDSAAGEKGLTPSHAVLMNAPAAPASSKAYRAIAHLADDVGAFMAVGQALRTAGLSVPDLYAADRAQGFLMLEDLGDDCFATALAAGVPLVSLYATATDVLLHLRRFPPARRLPIDASGAAHKVPLFDLDALSVEVAQLLDWHWPEVHRQPAPAEVRASFAAAFTPLLKQVAADTSGWVLRDFHSPNLFWLPGRAGIQRVGVIDFQDAMCGSSAYDVAALLQDARLDVSPNLERTLLDHYCALAKGTEPGFDEADFRRAYAILGAQRATKILGIFVRLWRRDGKRGYLVHLPRLWRNLERNLTHPDLGALRNWFDQCYRVEHRGRLG